MTNRSSGGFEGILALVVVFAIIVGVVAYQVASWRECRRVHPFWYCAMRDGR